MDREIDPQIVRRRMQRRVLAGLALLAALGGVWWTLPRLLRTSVRRTALRTARVERGPIEAVIEASGLVVPAFERALSSPVEARVERILRRAGEPVRRGEEILALDTAASRLEIERSTERLAQKDNEREQRRLALDRALAELRSRIQTQQLDLEVLRYRAEQRRKLHAEGLIAEEAWREAEAAARKGEIELEQLRSSVAAEERATAAALEALALDARILRKERDEAARQLELATARSDRDGVVTWVVPQEGVTLPRGAVLARIADLGSFRVEATVSDVHAARLAVGRTVRVVLDGAVLAGRLSHVYPTIESGAVRFLCDLDDATDRRLRNNLRVDVLVVTDRREQALTVAKGPFAQGAAVQQVFVVRGDRAVRTRARFGLAGYDRYEVLEGLGLGDEVIVSDMQDYLSAAELGIR
ncbi:MAG TPA: HlyD family efflux transporter periplasmic adaptor subunit [Candidatus Polarisedimenticolaceae bacterium]|nr:HlyD family efflux transporter periplasmic adaptor subunit [Candidatus Polarisedimenticolaceae bacterium]